MCIASKGASIKYSDTTGSCYFITRLNMAAELTCKIGFDANSDEKCFYTIEAKVFLGTIG